MPLMDGSTLSERVAAFQSSAGEIVLEMYKEIRQPYKLPDFLLQPQTSDAAKGRKTVYLAVHHKSI